MKWISVKDRLPKSEFKSHYVSVLAYGKDKMDHTTFIGNADYFYPENYWTSHDCCGHELDITHWAPLPELPKD